jgi:NCAIR mutase (PurE)-related protein
VDPQLLELLQSVANGVLTAGDASVQLSGLVSQGHGAPAEAAVGRAEFPEVVWGEHKTAGQLLGALHRIAERQGMAAATRVPAAVAAEVLAADGAVTYNDAAHMLVLKSATTKQAKLPGSVALICAGTADAGVVEECRVMLAAAGCYAFKLAESGVMGMHRWARRSRGSRVGEGADERQRRMAGGVLPCILAAAAAGFPACRPAASSCALSGPLTAPLATSAGLCRIWTP